MNKLQEKVLVASQLIRIDQLILDTEKVVGEKEYIDLLESVTKLIHRKKMNILMDIREGFNQ